LAYRAMDIPTIEARNILPAEFTRATLIQHAQNLAQFVHALHAGKPNLAIHSLKDIIAEPYRQALLPNFQKIKAELMAKFAVKAVGISGSGPTLFSIVDAATDIQGAKRYLQEHYVNFENSENKLKEDEVGFVVLAEVNTLGVESR